ncbi:MAG: hypothetical protein IT280_10195 [Ignavibacteria bacterium]|nr:hypothetical protein [Ignavibacteria bacterium]
MKVPTFQKFGITKARISTVENRDKKISDILTHHLTIGIGLAFGLVLYIIYFAKVQPESFIQIVVQIFLFGSIGIICVGIPALLFKLAEMFYFKHIKTRTSDYYAIESYTADRENYDFWKLRMDFSFWNKLDGLSFEKEVMNLYLHLGYTENAELNNSDIENERVLCYSEKLYYFTFYTKITEFKESIEIDNLLERMQNAGCNELNIYSQKGFSKKINEYSKDNPVNLFDINGIIKVARTIKN